MNEVLASFPLLFGVIASIIHVVAGPDHLAAVSPLAVRAKFRPWMIGFSWGIGHVAGMLLIGLFFFFFRELIPVDFISENSERIVGILLIVIGVWALIKIKGLVSHDHAHDHTHENEDGSVYIHRHDHSHSEEDNHGHSHSKKKERQTYLAAAGIGILHGFAGVSHIVSMLPTMAFKNNVDAIKYLVGFGIGTIIAMVVFSFVLGRLAKAASDRHKTKVLIGINIAAGLSAIIVGVIWMWNTW